MVDAAPLFTSIPPKIARKDAAGDEIGESYQAECITSWLDAGFAPTTVNARSEGFAPDPRVRRVTLERDASEITGKPHPYFGDLIEAVAAHADGPFALVNADILIPPSTGLSERVASLGRGQMIFGRRLDVARVGGRGKPFFYGYDLFAAHSADVVALAKSQLVFGAPWWDHFFPLVMHLQGSRLTQLEPQVVHLHHVERWDWSTYTKLGDRFMTEMRSMVADGRYARHLQNALAGGSGSRLATARDSMLLSRGRRLSSEPDRLMVDRVAHLNLAVIDRLAPVPASSAVRTPFGLRARDRLLRIGAASDGFSASTS